MANKKGMKTSKKKSAAQGDEGLKPYTDEMILIGTLVFCILVILSMFNLCGKVGNAINGLLFGLFGIMAYILPFAGFIGTAFYISNKGSRKARRKLISSVILMVVITTISQLAYQSQDMSRKLADCFQLSAETKKGGGAVGALFRNILCYFFDEAGAYVILLGISAFLVMLITEKLIFANLSKSGYKKMKEMKERQTIRKEQAEQVHSVPENTAETKRKAKTFIISKEEDEVCGRKKIFEKEKKGGKLLKEREEPVGMEEIVPEVVKEIKNKKGRKQEEPVMEMEQEPFYEKILNEKFNPANASCEISSTENIPEFPIHRERVVPETGEIEMTVEEPSVEETSVEEEKLTKKEENNTVYEEKAVVEPIYNTEERKPYVFPPMNLLSLPKGNRNKTSDQELKETAMKLHKTLESFGVKVTINNVSCGPTVTRYELQPEQGVKVSKITGLADDIKLNLAAADVRIEAPIPGKAAIGIEVPNKENSAVLLRELIEAEEFKNHGSNIAFAVGKDISGKTIVTDIGKMPHLLIAGATGSGKSVCINTLIMSILYKADPEDVKLIMVDPKVVELSVYNGIPHLLIPVVTEPKKASAALNWGVMEMTERYNKFAELGVRDLKGYNAKVKQVEDGNDERFRKMPEIVIIVDELADLMMVAPGEVEEAICRLAQLARAAGIHLVIATQRPSVNVITGVIKANIPSRIAFSVSSAVDSRTIIDGAGAEKLLGKGDMLFYPAGYAKPIRVQGAFVSDQEVSAVVEFLKQDIGQPVYDSDVAEKIATTTKIEADGKVQGIERDDYFIEAGKFIIEKDKASIGMLQRVYKIGFNRAARIMDQLYEAGVVSEEEGTKPRKVIMSMEEFEQYVDESV
ncbi:FtsK/SpoIIIE family DNA translocase [Anaeromicropila populeti]|uniref:DNA segregation ATPase FtsK/SpoIIIE, S-DNA-T family n=1 Tax=Anaeromicropila populeti TaxID=37658 RepID=A0A1I6KHK9_9FIRM|nr:DNA translocase FtsK [Anaeromicropila populeti]SFR90701.1 DNA segregation ATPase FtsK/SpoIIIE, S-DNA-T family [Anaeromicropila populeti]